MLGTDLVIALAPHFSVVGTGRRKMSDLPVPYVSLDLLDKKATRDFFEKERPALIFHTAAMTNVDGCERDRGAAVQGNEQMTRNVAEAAKAIDAFLVFFSTDYVFDGKKKGGYLEEDPTAPLNVYGETKRKAEEAIQDSGSRFAIFRTSWLYGLHGGSFPRTILEKGASVASLKVVCDQVGRPTYTQDIAQAFQKALLEDEKVLEKAAGQICNLANDGTASWADFAQEILRLAHFEGVDVEFVDSAQVKRDAVRPLNSVLSLDKTERVLGIHLRPWQAAIRDFVTLLDQEGVLHHHGKC